MPVKKTVVQQFTAWSYSRLRDWEKCPRLAKYKHLDKRREPDSEAQARGTRIHQEAEQYATGVLAKMPESLECFKEEFAALRKIRKSLVTEGQIGLARDWSVTDWFDSDARDNGLPLPWCRVVMDLRYVYEKKGKATKRGVPRTFKTVKIVDHKTGKVREENEDQLSLYAVAGFALHPEAEMVDAELWYLDQGELKSVVFTPDQLPQLKKEWEARVAPMMKDTTFKPNPTNACRWCHHRKANGGPCEF